MQLLIFCLVKRICGSLEVVQGVFRDCVIQLAKVMGFQRELYPIYMDSEGVRLSITSSPDSSFIVSSLLLSSSSSAGKEMLSL